MFIVLCLNEVGIPVCFHCIHSYTRKRMILDEDKMQRVSELAMLGDVWPAATSNLCKPDHRQSSEIVHHLATSY